MVTKKVRINIARAQDRLLPRIFKSQIEKMVFSFIAPRIKEHVLLHGKLGGSPVFCIVHWNAPDYLLLNVSQIELLYPKSKIYILDNGSQQANINAIVKGLKQFNNVTLFTASLRYPNWETRIGADHWLYSHSKGLQFLLNYAAEQRDEIAVFLDQDCLLSNNIDELFAKFGKNVILIGVKDGDARGYNLVHASFMILQPNLINQLFGKFSFFREHANLPEPYHGLSFKASGKILFLEIKPNDEAPVSSYSIQDTTYALHAWFSASAREGMSDSWLPTRRKLAFQYLKQIHEKTIEGRLNT